MKIIDVALTAGQSVQIGVSGFYFRLLNADYPVDVEINGQLVQDMQAGLGVQWGARITTLIFTSANAQTITYAVSDLPVNDARTVGKVNTYEVGSESISHSAITVGTSATLIASTNAKRRGVLIQPDTDIWIGGPGVTTANGVKVSASQSFVLNTTAEVYAIANVAGVDVRIMDEANT